MRHLAKMVPAYKLPLTNGRKVTPFNRAIAEGTLDASHVEPADPGFDCLSAIHGRNHGPVQGRCADPRQHRRGDSAGRGLVHARRSSASGDVSKTNSIAALPLYHIFALTLCLLAIRWGSHLTLVPNPRDIGKFIEVLKKRPFHLFPAVNTLFNALLQHPQFKSIDFSQLCLSQAGGMAASEGTAKQWHQATGCPMIEGWGMSETCAIGTNNS